MYLLTGSQDFLHTWPKIRDWIFRGPGRKKGPIVLVGHNIISYDIPLLKKELGMFLLLLLNYLEDVTSRTL